jgi:hypothetical protein
MMAGLHLVPVTQRQAIAFVAALHRHNKPPRGDVFRVACAADDGALVGVCMVGRPVARSYDDGWTLEVLRTCTDGTRNANSFLYGAARRVATALGYRRLITYTQADETGASLRAAGWRMVALREARGSWAQSTRDPRLLQMRDPVGNGGVQRWLWEAPL